MTWYEIKKVFSRPGSKAAVAVLAAVVAVSCYLATHIAYVNEQGDNEYGRAAVMRLRAAQKEWAGVLDTEKIRQVIEANNRVNQSPEGQAEDVRSGNIAYGRKQGFLGIRSLLNYAYAEGFRISDWYRADVLTPDMADQFYERRIGLLKDWLYDETGEAYYRYSPREKQFLVTRYETLQTPLAYDYAEGWVQLFRYAVMVIMLCMILLGYLVSGIFAGEFVQKADAVFFSSYYGRNKAIAAKLKAGAAIVTAVYFGAVCCYSAFVLWYLGADGYWLPVQAHWSAWKCFYHLTVWQKYLIIVFGGYVGCLFISLLCMWVSAAFKSRAAAVMVPIAMEFVPSFLGNISNAAADKIIGLLPDRLLDLDVTLNLFHVYTVGHHVVGSVPLLFVLYGALAALFVPVIYGRYRHTQAMP